MAAWAEFPGPVPSPGKSFTRLPAGQLQLERPWSPTADGPDWAATSPEEPAGLLEGGQAGIRDHSASHLQPALGEQLWCGSLSKHEGDAWRAVAAHRVARLRAPAGHECSLPPGCHLEVSCCA